MLNAADGSFAHNPPKYINIQLRYHLNFSQEELDKMDDEDWAEHYAILNDIRKEEAKHN